MVMQSEFVARWADGKRLVFIGDGDAISVCVAYFKHRDVWIMVPQKSLFSISMNVSSTPSRDLQTRKDWRI